MREENEPGEAYSARVAGLDLVGVRFDQTYLDILVDFLYLGPFGEFPRRRGRIHLEHIERNCRRKHGCKTSWPS